MGNQKKIRLNVDIPEDDFVRLKVTCALTGKSISDIVRSGISREVRSLEKKASDKASRMNIVMEVQA